MWGQEALGLPIHDNWWQTETGGIMVANYRSMDVRPGSMGTPAARHRGGGGKTRRARARRCSPPTERSSWSSARTSRASSCCGPGWPSMFRGYLGDDERYRKCFAGGWYLTGDLVRRDDDGYFWFVGSRRRRHQVRGPPDRPVRGRERAARASGGGRGGRDRQARPRGRRDRQGVRLAAPGFEPSDELRLELLGFARQRLGAAVAPREIDFVRAIPHNRSGKIMRRLLKARELGLPEGDTSTLEASA